MDRAAPNGHARPDGIIRFSVWLTFFNTWVLIEETIIDRYGLWTYLPYYRFGRLCAWDIGAGALIAWGVARALRARRAPPNEVP